MQSNFLQFSSVWLENKLIVFEENVLDGALGPFLYTIIISSSIVDCELSTIDSPVSFTTKHQIQSIFPFVMHMFMKYLYCFRWQIDCKLMRYTIGQSTFTWNSWTLLFMEAILNTQLWLWRIDFINVMPIYMHITEARLAKKQSIISYY